MGKLPYYEQQHVSTAEMLKGRHMQPLRKAQILFLKSFVHIKKNTVYVVIIEYTCYKMIRRHVCRF